MMMMILFSDVSADIAVAFFRVGELVVIGGAFCMSGSECFGRGYTKVALVVVLTVRYG